MIDFQFEQIINSRLSSCCTSVVAHRSDPTPEVKRAVSWYFSALKDKDYTDSETIVKFYLTYALSLDLTTVRHKTTAIGYKQNKYNKILEKYCVSGVFYDIFLLEYIVNKETTLFKGNCTAHNRNFDYQ